MVVGRLAVTHHRIQRAWLQHFEFKPHCCAALSINYISQSRMPAPLLNIPQIVSFTNCFQEWDWSGGGSELKWKQRSQVKCRLSSHISHFRCLLSANLHISTFLVQLKKSCFFHLHGLLRTTEMQLWARIKSLPFSCWRRELWREGSAEKKAKKKSWILRPAGIFWVELHHSWVYWVYLFSCCGLQLLWWSLF